MADQAFLPPEEYSMGAVPLYDKKQAEGKTRKGALRALKQRISDAVYQRLVADQS